MLYLSNLKPALAAKASPLAIGKVTAVRSGTIHALIPLARLGELCSIELDGDTKLPAQVVAFSGSNTILSALGPLNGLAPHAKVVAKGEQATVKISDALLGSTIDALGNPISCISEFNENVVGIKVSIFREALSPFDRVGIDRQLVTGLKGIDALCPIGYGQRIGVFAQAGVGKSTLLGDICVAANSDVNVVALVGERGREVRDFVIDQLGASGMRKSVVVVATSDEPPLRRVYAPFTAATIAEYFSRQGKSVLLVIDSITRFARALREVGIASGELPVRHGFTESVYRELPRLFERAGSFKHGSITGVYSVLCGDDLNGDSLGEEVKSLLDGHIILDQQIAHSGIRPAIDYVRSISRIAARVSNKDCLSAATKVRKVIAELKAGKDALLFGATPSPELKACLNVEARLTEFLHQLPQSPVALEATLMELSDISKEYQAKLQCTTR